jgi:glycosyltransferase involved in cell wall biosynthesis
MYTLIHVTHEAHRKMGGIGAVLEGMLTARAYQATVGRTLLLGCGEVPLSASSGALETVFYESGTAGGPPPGCDPALAAAFASVEATYGVRLLYGRRRVPCPHLRRRTGVELLLFDVRDARPGPVNQLKAELWQGFGLESDRFENDWCYEEWVRLAAPALEAVGALVGGKTDEAALISHEFMGLPTLLAARLRAPDLTTVYWAHEVPPVRDLLEREAGHRLVFDRAMTTPDGSRAYEAKLRELAGCKHALVSRAHRAGAVFAVSDRVAQELGLLSGGFRKRPIDVVYNGLAVRPIDLDARLASRALLRRYAAAVTGLQPDYVFTHVARPVASKAIERDLAVLDHLDDALADRGRTAVLLVLATDGGRRQPETIRQMESEHNWPMQHRVGWPDLVKGEVPIGRAAEEYNRWARATRVVLINQFGFTRASCGDRMPEAMALEDLRQGSDVEFGQSTYEPFGIAQLETLAFGGISVMTSACGCAELLARVADGDLPANVLTVDYAAPDGAGTEPVGDTDTRRIEHEVAARVAGELIARLPTGPQDIRRLLASGWALAERMSWQSVCRAYFVPALERCFGKTRRPERSEEEAGGDSHPATKASPEPVSREP